ncbi:MAG: LytS/YhcK type 5TM receptor domain-containing protein [Bacillota bacterium]
MPWELTLHLAEKLGIVATIAFILSRTKVFQRLISESLSPVDKALLVLIFSAEAIVGTYTGISIQGALANSRVVGIMVAGLLGGPFIGVTVGAIAGIHRYFLGGFTAASCGIAAVVEGLFAGLLYRLNNGKPVPWYFALVAGMAGEAVQMLIILLMARPYESAVTLVNQIGLPMILVNSIGIAVFMLIVSSVHEARQRIAAVQAEKILNIASETLPHLRQGLSRESARAVAELIYKSAKVSAVAITDSDSILAHMGLGEDHHLPGMFPLTSITATAMKTGETQIARSKEEISCGNQNCKLASSVVVPLKQNKRVIGALKLYKDRKDAITALDLRLAKGLADLFSTQLELGELERQARLAAKSELKALQAQVNPHFLFNSLNTIVSLVRTQPESARDLLVKLANFFRHTLSQPDRLVTLGEELAFTQDYLAIEKARFGEKLQYRINISEDAGKYYIPFCTIQPLVENSVKHGLKEKEDGGNVEISILCNEDTLEIEVTDDGVGIPYAEQEKVLQYRYGKNTGIGMSIVNSRLAGLFGSKHALQIKSKPGAGTSIKFKLPLLTDRKDVLDEKFKGIGC